MSMRNRQQSGMALVAAIFLIVVLAGLGLVATRLSSAQQQGVNTRVLVARAQAAADSGIEWGIYQALTAGVCNTTTSLPLTQVSLRNFTALVSCTSHNHQLNGVTYQVYQLTSRAQHGAYGQPDYVFRQATRSVSNAP
ncbi:MAG: agglutinin biogenesis protein MshP [Steroidobacteraceae bacterium]